MKRQPWERTVEETIQQKEAFHAAHPDKTVEEIRATIRKREGPPPNNQVMRSRAARDIEKICKTCPKVNDRLKELRKLERQYKRELDQAHALMGGATYEGMPGLAWDQKRGEIDTLSEDKKVALLTKASEDFDLLPEAIRTVRRAVLRLSMPFSKDGVAWRERMQKTRDRKDSPAIRDERVERAKSSADMIRKAAPLVIWKKTGLIREIWKMSGIPQSTLREWVDKGILPLSLHSPGKL